MEVDKKIMKQSRYLFLAALVVAFAGKSAWSLDATALQTGICIKPSEFQLYDPVTISITVSNSATQPVKILQLSSDCLSLDLLEGDKRLFIIQKREPVGGFQLVQILKPHASITAEFPLQSFAHVLAAGKYDVSCKFLLGYLRDNGVAFETVGISCRTMLNIAPREGKDLQKLVDEISVMYANKELRELALKKLLSINNAVAIDGLMRAWNDASAGLQMRIVDALVLIGDKRALEVIENLMATGMQDDVELYMVQRLSSAEDAVISEPVTKRIWRRGLQSRNEDTRLSCVGYVLQYSKQEAQGWLSEIKNDSSQKVRTAVAKALTTLGVDSSKTNP